MHPEFPYVAFAVAALVLVPMPWHWRAGNVATLSMIAWLFATNIIYGVDAVVWANNVRTIIPVWCDITTKLLIGANIAFPAACMCVCMHLERVASVRQVRTTLADKRRRQYIEAFMCFGLPIMWMALHYIVQGHRFDIIEEYGCRPATYVSIPAIFLIWVSPLILSIATLAFALLALHHFIRRRITFASHLESRSGLTTARYLRLMLLAIAEMVLSVGSTALALWSATLPLVLRPWTNWSDVHWHFSRIATFRTSEVPSQISTYYYALWWITPISGFLFFLFFAFGQDAVQEYGACFKWLRERIFRLRVREKSQVGFKSCPSSANHSGRISSGTIPSFMAISSTAPSTPTAKGSQHFSQEGEKRFVDLPASPTSSLDSELPVYDHSPTSSSPTFSQISYHNKENH